MYDFGLMMVQLGVVLGLCMLFLGIRGGLSWCRKWFRMQRAKVRAHENKGPDPRDAEIANLRTKLFNLNQQLVNERLRNQAKEAQIKDLVGRLKRRPGLLPDLSPDALESALGRAYSRDRLPHLGDTQDVTTDVTRSFPHS